MNKWLLLLFASFHIEATDECNNVWVTWAAYQVPATHNLGSEKHVRVDKRKVTGPSLRKNRISWETVSWFVSTDTVGFTDNLPTLIPFQYRRVPTLIDEPFHHPSSSLNPQNKNEPLLCCSVTSSATIDPEFLKKSKYQSERRADGDRSAQIVHHRAHPVRSVRSDAGADADTGVAVALAVAAPAAAAAAPPAQDVDSVGDGAGVRRTLRVDLLEQLPLALYQQ